MYMFNYVYVYALQFPETEDSVSDMYDRIFKMKSYYTPED